MFFFFFKKQSNIKNKIYDILIRKHQIKKINSFYKTKKSEIHFTELVVDL